MNVLHLYDKLLCGDIMDLGARIKSIRKERKLTQKELANKAGIATITLQQYERGVREPKLEQIQKIASALGVSIGEMLAQEPMSISGITSGLISPKDIAEEMNISLDVVMNAIENPESVPLATREKIGAIGELLSFDPPPLARISQSLSKLNREGQEKAAERVEELTEIPRYQKEKGD